jgi:multiple sugar transport system permease protein
MKYYQSFFTDNIADPSVSTAIGAQESAFVNGSTPMLIASPSEISNLNQAGGAGFTSKYGVMQFPKQQSATSFVGGSDLVVFHNSAHRDAAWKLVQWLSQASVQASWYKATGDLPAVQSAWSDPSLSGDPKLVVFKAQLGDVKSPPANTGWTQVSAAADTQLERIVKSGTDPAAAMSALQSAADSMAGTSSAPAGSRRAGRGAVTHTMSMRRRQGLAAWLFALPFMLVFGVFMLVPLVSSFLMSFTDFRSTDVQTPLGVGFVGLKQYTALFENPQFRKSMLNTAYVVIVGIPLTMVIALALAVALNSGISRFRTAFRVGFYTPVVTSIVAVAVVWRFILQPDGLLNTLLGWIGITGPDWLHSTTWALPALIGMTAWRNMGTLMIIFLAGLQNVPRDVHEAAMVDGAGPWQRFRRITIPILRPTLLLGAVLLSVAYLQFFEESFVMTQGGPLDSTLSVSYFTYNQFGFGKYGYASAASYVLFAAIAALSTIQFRVLRSKD